jgi:hydrogenase expression/formation protein HypE
MRVGKIAPEVLRRVVMSQLGVRRPEVLVHSGLGEDSTVLDFGDLVAVMSTDPITGAAANSGWIAVHVACNDIAAMGAEPLGVLLTVLLDEGTDESALSILMRDVNRACLELGIEVVGGHSEVTSLVKSPVLSLTSVGFARREAYVTSAGGRPGDALILTKAAGLEGTAILATDRSRWLASRLTTECLDGARAFLREISVVREGIAAARAGASAMHDVTEGGVLGAAYELAIASGCGIDLNADAVPVRAETRSICAEFGIDPLRLVSSGAMLIAAPNAEPVLAAVSALGVDATVIGELTAGSPTVLRSGQREPLMPPETDELYRALSVGE